MHRGVAEADKHENMSDLGVYARDFDVFVLDFDISPSNLAFRTSILTVCALDHLFLTRYMPRGGGGDRLLQKLA